MIEDIMQHWWKDSKEINVLITGRTGVGKSTLVNAILGQKVAEVGKSLDPQTSIVESFEGKIHGITVRIWDSPGLQDGLNNEEAYLKDIEKKCKGKIDLFLYCISMTTPRFTQGSRDIDAMCKLTSKLGKDLWKNAVIILTCANKFITATKASVPDCDDEQLSKLFDERVQEWTVKLRQCLKENVGLEPQLYEEVQVVPAGRKGLPRLLKSRSPWLSTLWIESLLVTKHRAQPALIKMNLERLKSSTDAHSEEEFEELIKKENIIVLDTARAYGRIIGADEAGIIVGITTGIKIYSISCI